MQMLRIFAETKTIYYGQTTNYRPNPQQRKRAVC
jgi:hypothetical protein